MNRVYKVVWNGIKPCIRSGIVVEVTGKRVYRKIKWNYEDKLGELKDGHNSIEIAIKKEIYRIARTYGEHIQRKPFSMMYFIIEIHRLVLKLQKRNLL